MLYWRTIQLPIVAVVLPDSPDRHAQLVCVNKLQLLPTAREGNVFRGVCQPFCSQGKEGLPPGQRPPRTKTPSRQTPPLWTETPRTETPQTDQAPPRAEPPQDRDPPGQKPPPWKLTSSGGHFSGQYASYSNAFFLYSCFNFPQKIVTSHEILDLNILFCRRG